MQAVAVSEAGPPRSLAHPQCSLCIGTAPSLIVGVEQAEAVSHLDLEEDRPDGFHIVLLLHGRRERTELLRTHIQLRGRASGDPQPSIIQDIHEPRDWQDRRHYTLVGVTSDRTIPREPGKRSAVLVPGTFLVFGDEQGTARCIATLPIAHIVRYQIAPRAYTISPRRSGPMAIGPLFLCGTINILCRPPRDSSHPLQGASQHVSASTAKS